MHDVNRLLRIYNSSLADKVKKLAEPLKTHYGIDEFIYSYVMHDGHYFSISNQPQASMFWYEKRYYETTLLVRSPEHVQSDVLLPSHIPGEKQAAAMRQEFGLSPDNLLAILKKEKKNLHYFLFNTTKNDRSLFPIYISNLKILDCFCDHFLKEWAPYQKQMEEYAIDMAKLIGRKLWLAPPHKEIHQHLNGKIAFLKKIGTLPGNFSVPKLSKQEKLCLDHLYAGNSVREAAELMGLSLRTVEQYVVHIKNKLQADSRSQMIDAYHKLKLLGIY